MQSRANYYRSSRPASFVSPTAGTQSQMSGQRQPQYAKNVINTRGSATIADRYISDSATLQYTSGLRRTPKQMNKSLVDKVLQSAVVTTTKANMNDLTPQAPKRSWHTGSVISPSGSAGRYISHVRTSSMSNKVEQPLRQSRQLGRHRPTGSNMSNYTQNYVSHYTNRDLELVVGSQNHGNQTRQMPRAEVLAHDPATFYRPNLVRHDHSNTDREAYDPRAVARRRLSQPDVDINAATLYTNTPTNDASRAVESRQNIHQRSFVETEQSFDVTVSIDQFNLKRHGRNNAKYGTALDRVVKQLYTKPTEIIPVEQIQIVQSPQHENFQKRMSHTVTIMHDDDVAVAKFEERPRRHEEQRVLQEDKFAVDEEVNMLNENLHEVSRNGDERQEEQTLLVEYQVVQSNAAVTSTPDEINNQKQPQQLKFGIEFASRTHLLRSYEHFSQKDETVDFETYLKDMIARDYNAGRSQPIEIRKLRIQSSSGDNQSFVAFPAVPKDHVSAFVKKRLGRKNDKLSVLAFVDEVQPSSSEAKDVATTQQENAQLKSQVVQLQGQMASIQEMFTSHMNKQNDEQKKVDQQASLDAVQTQVGAMVDQLKQFTDVMSEIKTKLARQEEKTDSLLKRTEVVENDLKQLAKVESEHQAGIFTRIKSLQKETEDKFAQFNVEKLQQKMLEKAQVYMANFKQRQGDFDMSMLQADESHAESRYGMAVPEQRQQLDMAFFYADPLVARTNEGLLVEYSVPLDLATEYAMLQSNLAETNKQFCVAKEAMSLKSLHAIISQNPTLLHISCHGSYELSDSDKQFYLSIEGDNNDGLEEKLFQQRLSQVLQIFKDKKGGGRHRHSIQLAFVSACQSEEIGNIFQEAGVPVVIAVNADQEIMDEACKIFSSVFYQSLLLGRTIGESVSQAKLHVQCSNKDYNACCCAHDHDDDCVWFKFYKQDPRAAHAIHSKECGCSSHGVNGNRQHAPTCNALREFNQFIRDEKLKVLGQTPQEKKVADSDDDESGAGGGLAGLNFSDDSDMQSMEELGQQIQVAEEVGRGDPTGDELLLCCCRKKLQHDETIKFVVKTMKTADHINPLEKVLFPQRQDGPLIQFGNVDETYINRVPITVQKKMLFGRHLYIHEVITFLAKQDAASMDARVLFVNGPSGVGCCSTVVYAVNYLMDRHQFQDGAFLIEAKDKVSVQGLQHAISRKIGLLTNEISAVVKGLMQRKMVLVLNGCAKLLQRDAENFFNFISQLAKTQYMKFIIITNKNEDVDFSSGGAQLKHAKQIRVKHLDRNSAAKLLFSLSATNNPAIARTFVSPVKLAEHELFRDFSFTPRDVSKMCLLVENGTDLKAIYDIYKEQEVALREQSTKEERDKKADYQMNKVIYNKIKEYYPREINVLNLLSFAPQGLLLDDIIRIIHMAEQDRASKLEFGDWKCFVEDVILCGQASTQDREHDYFDFDKQYEDEDDERRLKNMQGFKVVDSQFIANIQQVGVSLNVSLQQFIQKEMLSQDEQYQMGKLYLKYQAITLRQLIQSIKTQLVTDFDPYEMSAAIDQGLWAPHKLFEHEMVFHDDNLLRYSKEQTISHPVSFFCAHELNYFELVDCFNDYFPNKNEDDREVEDPDLVIYTEEFCVCLLTVQIMLKRSKDALQTIDRVELIYKKNQMALLNGKTNLIKASLWMDLKKDSNFDDAWTFIMDAEDVFIDTNNSEGSGEVSLLQGIFHIYQVKKITRQKQEMDELSGQSQDDLLQRQQSQSRFGGYQASQVTRKDSLSSYLSAAASQQDMHLLAYKDEVKEEFADAIQYLKEARDKLKNELAKARSCIVQAEFILITVADVDEIQSFLEHSRMGKNLVYKHLADNLETALSHFDNNDLLYLKCLFYLAKCYFLTGNYKKSRAHVSYCISMSRELDTLHIFDQAHQLLQDVAKRIKHSDLNNQFVFIKSCPLRNVKWQKQETLIQKQLIDDSKLLRLIFQGSRKQIDINFDILTKSTLERVRDYGCKVLHLTPQMFKLTRERTYFYIEDEDFCHVKITLEQLRELLTPKKDEGKKGLPISLVVLELINGPQLTQMFSELGVDHVVTFQCDRDFSDVKKMGLAAEFALTNGQAKLLKMQKDMLAIVTYMTKFLTSFYPQVLSSAKPLVEAVEMANKVATQEMRDLNTNISIKGIIVTRAESLKNKALFSESQQRRLKEGNMIDISRLRAQSNIEFDASQTPFMVRRKNHFSKLVSKLATVQKRSDDLSNVINIQDERDDRPVSINIYGQPGTGKTSFVRECVRYLRYRYSFANGIYVVDMNKVQDFADIHEMLNNLRVAKGQKSTDSKKLEVVSNERNSRMSMNSRKSSNNKQKQRKRNDKRVATPKANSLLIIFDNVDEFLLRNQRAFSMNIQYLQDSFDEYTLQILFVSEQKLMPNMLDPVWHYKLCNFSKFETRLFLQTIDKDRKRVKNEQEEIYKYALDQGKIIFDKSGGNPKLVKILNMIKWIGKQGETSHFLDIVEVLPTTGMNEAAVIDKIGLHLKDAVKEKVSNSIFSKLKEKTAADLAQQNQNWQKNIGGALSMSKFDSVKSVNSAKGKKHGSSPMLDNLMYQMRQMQIKRAELTTRYMEDLVKSNDQNADKILKQITMRHDNESESGIGILSPAGSSARSKFQNTTKPKLIDLYKRQMSLIQGSDKQIGVNTTGRNLLSKLVEIKRSSTQQTISADEQRDEIAESVTGGVLTDQLAIARQNSVTISNLDKSDLIVETNQNKLANISEIDSNSHSSGSVVENVLDKDTGVLSQGTDFADANSASQLRAGKFTMRVSVDEDELDLDYGGFYVRAVDDKNQRLKVRLHVPSYGDDDAIQEHNDTYSMREDQSEIMILQPADVNNFKQNESKEELRGGPDMMHNLKVNFKSQFKGHLEISNINNNLADGHLYAEMNTPEEWSKIQKITVYVPAEVYKHLSQHEHSCDARSSASGSDNESAEAEDEQCHSGASSDDDDSENAWQEPINSTAKHDESMLIKLLDDSKGISMDCTIEGDFELDAEDKALDRNLSKTGVDDKRAKADDKLVKMEDGAMVTDEEGSADLSAEEEDRKELRKLQTERSTTVLFGKSGSYSENDLFWNSLNDEIRAQVDVIKEKLVQDLKGRWLRKKASSFVGKGSSGQSNLTRQPSSVIQESVEENED